MNVVVDIFAGLKAASEQAVHSTGPLAKASRPTGGSCVQTQSYLRSGTHTYHTSAQTCN